MLNCAKILAVGLHLATMHSQDGYNDINPGAYIRLDCNVVAGAYYNSESNMSAYAGMVFEKQVGRFAPFIVAGAVVGYESYPVAPLLTPAWASRFPSMSESDWPICPAASRNRRTAFTPRWNLNSENF